MNIYFHFRSFALQTPGVLSIWDLGLSLLRVSFDQHVDVLTKLITSLFAAVEGDRRGLAVDKDILSRLIRMLVLLGFYVDRFEQPLLKDSVRFFSTEGQTVLETSDIALFMQVGIFLRTFRVIC
jgi:cullin-4